MASFVYGQIRHLRSPWSRRKRVSKLYAYFCKMFSVKPLQAFVLRCLIDDTFGHFERILALGIQTDRFIPDHSIGLYIYMINMKPLAQCRVLQMHNRSSYLLQTFERTKMDCVATVWRQSAVGVSEQRPSVGTTVTVRHVGAIFSFARMYKHRSHCQLVILLLIMWN